MTALISIVSFLAVIMVLIIVHELGHFVTAKLTGVGVLEFGLGFPPRLLSIKRGETTYSLNALPLGGFVKMVGEEDPDVPRSLASKSIPVRLLVLGAGSTMNLLLPLLLLSIAFMVPHDTLIGQVTVQAVAPNSPAAEAGIEPGDILLSINEQPVDNNGDVHRYIQLNLGKEIIILVQHSDSTIEEVRLTARRNPPEGEGAVGVAIRIIERYPFWEAIKRGVGGYGQILIELNNGVISMIAGAVPVAVVGPVGIAQLTGEVARIGISPLLQLAALISINLGLVNLFPIPALDGGRIAFVLLEWVRRGKRVSAKTEGLIHAIGFFLLIGAILAITYQDIMRLISGESLIP